MHLNGGDEGASSLTNDVDGGTHGGDARGEGRGGIYRVVRDCVVTAEHALESAKTGKLRKRDEIVVIEWRLLASPPVMRVRCADGWCTEREMDGALNLEHIHGAKVGEMDEPADSSLPLTPGRRKSVSVMSAQERQALRRASVEVAKQQLQTHLLFRDGEVGGGSASGVLQPSLSSPGDLKPRRLLNDADGNSPTATTCGSRYVQCLLCCSNLTHYRTDILGLLECCTGLLGHGVLQERRVLQL